MKQPYLPTDAIPGTEDKIQVMIARAKRYWPLFNPLDAALPDTLYWPYSGRLNEDPDVAFKELLESIKNEID